MRLPRKSHWALSLFAAVVALTAWNRPTLAAAPATQPTGDPYMLDTCPVSGEKLGEMGDPVVINYQGREIRFCCGMCPAKFNKEPAKYLAVIDKATIEKQMASYPTDKCLVSNEKLGEDEKPVDFVYNNRLVRFCCNMCLAKFKKDPSKTLAALDKAVIEKQKPAYPLDTCVVSGKKLGDGAVDLVVGNRLVRLCCGDCVAAVKKNPTKYLQKIDDAAKAKAPAK